MSRVAYLVMHLRECDWVTRHEWYDWASHHGRYRRIVLQVASAMSSSELLYGLNDGFEPDAVIALPGKAKRQLTLEEAFKLQKKN